MRALILGFFLLVPAVGLGQPKAPPAPALPAGQGGAAGTAGGAEEPKFKVERGAGGKKIIRLEAIRIEGKIQKPEAFFFYQKSNINYEWQELKQDFIPKILESVSRAPF